MRHYLRKIRNKFLAQGNLKKYLLYAIGEILLVMIGILLAFQVSNWSEESTNRKTELRHYENIKSQLNNDKGDINGNVDYNNLYFGQYKLAVEIIEKNDRAKLDTLTKISRNLFRYSDFNRESNIYEPW